MPLDCRFRSLKIWVLLRAYGIEGLHMSIRNHVLWANELFLVISGMAQIQINSTPRLSLFSFAHKCGDQATLDLSERINNDGRIYLTQTQHPRQMGDKGSGRTI